MSSYSMEFRKKVLKACDEGGTSREVAERFEVSRSWIDRLKQRRRETGEIGPQKPSRFKPQALANHMDRLRELVEERPDITLEEIRSALKVQTSLTSIWRALQRLDLTFKKKSFMPVSRSGQMSRLLGTAGESSKRS